MEWNSLTSSLTKSKSFSAILHKVVEIPKCEIKTPPYTEEHPDAEGNYYGPSTGMQGGCFNGRYFYQSILKYCYNKREAYANCHHVNNAKNIVRIIKYDVCENRIVDISKEMDCLNHINDITHNSKTGQLVICNSIGNRKMLSFVNAETLEYEGSQMLDIELYAADYHEGTDRYVLGVSNCRKFAIANDDFTEIVQGYGDVEAPHTYTKQNVCCDDNYIYGLYSGRGSRDALDAIFVYDWEGHFITFIELDFGLEEPENISVYNGALFVGTGGYTNVCFYNIEGLKEK